MITTFKTKEKVTVNARLGEKDYVYLDVRGLYFDGKKYRGDVMYYYVADGEYRTIEIVTPPEFTIEEATLIEQAGDPLVGNVSERLIQLVIRATFFQISQENYYKLTAADWEITFPPSETPVEPVIEPPIE